MSKTQPKSTRIAAIYARVSSERQRQDETIQSQTAGLRELAAERGLLLADDLVFEDEGFSGATLQRPALERLRDRAAEGAFELVLCHSPDRLARRYAYQVLLLEELARCGVEVCFAKEGERSGSPEDELLRQFQGMIAEYERAQIAERTRRGKVHRARQGSQAVLSGAPYGYRYVRKSEHMDAFYEISEPQAQVVREVFARYAEGGESIAQIARSLSEQGTPTATGKQVWDRSTVWAMLRNPAYRGQAAYGKTQMTGQRAKPTRPVRARGERHGRREQPTLLQGLLVCRDCGYACWRTSTRTTKRKISYYRCIGSDNWRHTGGRVCENRPIRADELDELVWGEVRRLLENPALIRAEIERRLDALRTQHPAAHRKDGLERELERVRAGSARLIEAYQESLIALEELRERMPALRKREATLAAQLDALESELHDAETYLKLAETLETFLGRLSESTDGLSIHERQRVLRLVVREVRIGGDNVTIRHSIPAPSGDDSPSCLLRGSSRDAALRGAGDRVPLGATLGEDASLEKHLHQTQDALVSHAMSHPAQKAGVRDFVEARLDVAVQRPLIGVGGQQADLSDGVMGSALGAEAVGTRLEVRLIDRLEHQLQRALDDAVPHNGNPEPATLARARLGDHPLPDWERLEPLGLQLGPQVFEQCRDAPPGLDRVGGLPVHSGRAGALVAPHPTPCHKQERRVTHEVVQVIEPAIRIVGCPSMQLGLNPQYPGLCLLRRRPWSARVHERPPGIPVPALRTCCLPSPCGRLSRPPTTTEAPPRPEAISRRRTCPLATWMANQEGDPRRFPRSLMRPVDKVGAQLCPGSLAMATPQSFTMASGPAICHRSGGVARRHRRTCAADRPIRQVWGRHAAYGALPLVHSRYTISSRLPDPGRLAVPACPVVVGAAPTLPRISKFRLPPSSRTCCDRPKAEPFHLRPVVWRLVAHAILGVVDDVLPIQRADAEAAKDILLRYATLSARDAVHAAVMRRNGIGRIMTFDRGFDAHLGIERLH